MKNKLFILIILISNYTFSQSISEIKKIDGIWIAEDFYNSFEKTKSIIKSKKAFDSNYPVALRINHNEIKNGILNIGYSTLHDHRLFPEVSAYKIVENDTLYEQGSFKINIKEKYSLTNYQTSEIGFFNYDCKSYLKIKNDKVWLFRPKSIELPEKTIKFVRITSGYNENYLFPNPLYYYTRSKIFTGNYTLMDNKSKVLTENFSIEPNGLIRGNSIFKGKYIHYSTDIFCGPTIIDELVSVCNEIEHETKYDCENFVFKRIDEKTIYLYKKFARNIFDTEEELGKETYILIKH